MDRRKFVTLMVVLFTVVLAGVAVFTAVRLYQQRQGSVSPTAPTSIPRAAETVSCETVSFTLATEPVCGGSCDPDDSATCPNNHTCSTDTNTCVLDACLVDGATCDEDQCNEITPTNPECGGTCDPEDSSTCPTDHTCNATTNTCELSVCLESSRTCTNDNCSLTPQCGDSCNTTAECSNNHTCSGGKCVLDDCLESGASCTADKCQTTTPAASTPTPTPEAPAPSLPDAGTGMPTVALTIVGLLTLIGALFFAL